MLTAYDPWVNLLRDTVACFAAGVGGADSITVLPYDALIDRPDRELGRRLARNTQSILALESNLGRVADPGAGSAYVEALTAGLAAAGWAFFQEIEAAGGFVAAVDNGSLAGRFAATWAARSKNIDNRKDPITGVSEFPNIDEPPPAHPGEPGHRWPARCTAAPSASRTCAPPSMPPAREPTVFLAAIGTPAQSTARITFAKNFFEVAGLRTLGRPGHRRPGGDRRGVHRLRRTHGVPVLERPDLRRARRRGRRRTAAGRRRADLRRRPAARRHGRAHRRRRHRFDLRRLRRPRHARRPRPRSGSHPMSRHPRGLHPRTPSSPDPVARRRPTGQDVRP